jgi:hypothetical protein
MIIYLRLQVIMFSNLFNHYWFIRYARHTSAKRRYYRHAEKEKKRLLEAGVDPEELRLLCRRETGTLRNASTSTAKIENQF